MIPIMMAIGMVQAPGIVAISEITIIENPDPNPANGPRVNPMMNVRVSVNPNAIIQA